MPAGFTEVLLNVMVGWLATSKKSGFRRCSSRLASFVKTVAAWIVNSTEELSGFARSTLMVPEKSWNLPPSMVKMWRTWKPTVVWDLSNW